MPICPYCGRQLAEGEVCYCQQNAASQQGVPYPNPAPQPQYQDPNQYQYPNQPQYQDPNQYQNQYQNPQDPNAQPQKKKMSTGCLIALIVGIVLLVLTLIVGGILAAILVPSMMGYVKKSKLASANSTAKNYYNAAASVLCDLDVDDVDIHGTYLISSEGDVNLPFSRSVFDERFEDYLTPDENGVPEHYDYVLVIEDSTCVYAAVSYDEFVGVYPHASTFDGFYDCEGKLYSDGSFDDVLYAANAYVNRLISYDD